MKKFLGLSVLGIVSAVLMGSCASEDPFGMSGEGEVRMRLVIKSDVTRAEVDDDALRSNCVVYISSEKGLIHKYQGLQNVPEKLQMKCGNYVAEAWTGDSVPASFDKKFYRGYQPFTVEKGVNSPVVKCGVANVVASVNTSTIDNDLMRDWVVTIGHSVATLDFTADNADDAKGYYMMPSVDNKLTYTVKGTNSHGQAFEKTGLIEGQGADGAVERAHEYVLNFQYNPEFEEIGGSFITIVVDDKEILVEDEIEILGRPTVSGVDFNIDKQVVGNARAFTDKIVKIAGFGDLKSIVLNTRNPEFGLPLGEIDLMNLTTSAEAEVAASGLKRDMSFNSSRNLATMYLTFTADMLNNLPEAAQEYRLDIKAVDKFGKYTEATLRIAVGEGAIVIEDPIVLAQIDQLSDMLAVGAESAVLSATLQNEDAVNPGIEYRVADSEGEWKFVGMAEAVKNSRGRSAKNAPAKQYKISLSGLAPATRYAYRATAEGFKGDTYYFTTEGKFVIPNAGMEDWSNWTGNSKVLIPSASGEREFWDSGNHGSATMSKTLTQGSTVMVSSGSRSAELKSQFVGLGSIGKFAAGNIFAGEYLETVGTDGKINFGRPYNGSHPKAVRVKVNYRPGKGVKSKGANASYIGEGQQDIGMIYVALSTEPYQVFTKSGDQQRLFDRNHPTILAYGDKVFNGAYGADGVLETLDIPFEYTAAAKTTRPIYLIIVCTASKFGDYFSGGEGSLMYLDDFELTY